MKSRAVARFRLFINALDIPEGNRTNERHRYIDVVRRYFGENNRHMFTVLIVNMCPLFCLSFISSVQYLPALRFAQRSIYLFIYLFIHSTTSTHNSGFSVEVKYEKEKNYYCEESDKGKEGWFTMGRSRTASAAAA